MPHTEYSDTFPCTKEELWSIVTALYDSDWRRDIEYINIRPGGLFLELTAEQVEVTDPNSNNGFQYQQKKTCVKRLFCTGFLVKEKRPTDSLSVSFDNDKVSGTLDFVFSAGTGGNGSQLTINGTVEGKKLFMKPFAKTWLVNRLKSYMINLAAAAKTPPKPSADKMTPHELVALTRAELSKSPDYDEDKHLYLLLNMFNKRYNREYEDVCSTTQAEVLAGAARIVSYRVTEQEDGDFLRKVAFERRTCDFREAVSILTQLVLNTARQNAKPTKPV